ncbi:MAG: hypothetical protein IMX02_06245 [Limnochordaceae bacterium]|nr:hypothetical protein [Limnochordaceae bacterium]
MSTYAARGTLPAPWAWLASGPIWSRAAIEAYRVAHIASPESKQEPVRQPEPEPKPAPRVERVRFTSRHGGLMLFGGPRGTVKFSGGVYETDDPEEIAWLRRLPTFGVDFREEPVTTS